MNFTDLPTNLTNPENDDACDHLKGKIIPNISLLTQDNSYLKLYREDTFRLVFFCFSMTGHPEKPLPNNWDNIPGAQGCTSQQCSIRDNYDEIIVNNALPIGLSTQSIEDLKEMTLRLRIPYDVLSDINLTFSSSLDLPTFTVDNNSYIKRLTLIVEQTVIKHVFYPIFPPDQHVKEVIKWLEEN